MTTTIEAVRKPAPELAPEKRVRRKKQPLYNVILLDDDDHTYEYVIGMLRKLFGHTTERAYQLASQVDETGLVVLDTTTLERAEFKRDQIHAFGRDWRITHCQGSMTSLIEPASR